MNVSLLRERENSLRGANGRLALAALVITGSAAHAELEYSTSFDTPDLPGLGIAMHGSAQIDNAFGQSDLKLVSDGQSGTWGTWQGPTVWGDCTSFTLVDPLAPAAPGAGAAVLVKEVECPESVEELLVLDIALAGGLLVPRELGITVVGGQLL